MPEDHENQGNGITCPQCGRVAQEGAYFCPNCGFGFENARLWGTPERFSWPPPPRGPGYSAAPAGKLILGRVWADMTLAALLFVVTATLVPLIGHVIWLIVYIDTRPKYPAFARGIGIGFFIQMLPILGILVACFGGAKLLHPFGW